MKRSAVISVLLGALMLSAGALSKHFTPTVKLADQSAKVDLERIIPTKFGDWTVDTSIVPLQVDPETQANLNKIYNQTLSRTYINSAGERVMLSLAYGGDQSDRMAVHKPEVCYAAQGFEVKKENFDEVRSSFGAIPVKRLFAVSGSRNEPITYWIKVGDRTIRPGMEQKLQQLRYGLTGVVPDGLLFRVSTIDADLPAAYRLQDRFINELLRSVDEPRRLQLAGILLPGT